MGHAVWLRVSAPTAPFVWPAGSLGRCYGIGPMQLPYRSGQRRRGQMVPPRQHVSHVPHAAAKVFLVQYSEWSKLTYLTNGVIILPVRPRG